MFIWVLRPVKIISIILSRESVGVVKMGIPREKPLDQAELGLSHMWPQLGSNQQRWHDRMIYSARLASEGDSFLPCVKQYVLQPISWYTDQTIFSKLTPASDIWWFFTLLLISKKMHFCTTENFGVKSWFLKTLLLRPKDRKYKQFIWKNISAYIFFDIIEYVYM